MKILLVLTYYRPYVSGLTIYVQRLAEGLVRRGHQVTILTSRHEPHLAVEETIAGVRIIRAPVALKISKGVIMPAFGSLAYRLARHHDVVNIHLPQFEAGLVSFIARVLCFRPVVLTYHCDLQLPAGIVNRIIDQVVFSMNYLGGLFANCLVAYTQDFAAHSRLLSRFLRKVQVIPPPVEIAPVDGEKRDHLYRSLHLDGHCIVGICTRVATEKGLEYVLEAIPDLEAELGKVHILHAGQYENVLGESKYFERLQPIVKRFHDRITFLGVLSPAELPAFFACCDVLVVSSVNSTESFGLVQVEAMLCGTPVVATNLPGVREPVRLTGMGEIVPVRDERAIARAVVRIVTHHDAYIKPREEIQAIFDLQRTLEAYEKLFGEYSRR